MNFTQFNQIPQLVSGHAMLAPTIHAQNLDELGSRRALQSSDVINLTLIFSNLRFSLSRIFGVTTSAAFSVSTDASPRRQNPPLIRQELLHQQLSFHLPGRLHQKDFNLNIHCPRLRTDPLCLLIHLAPVAFFPSDFFSKCLLHLI